MILFETLNQPYVLLWLMVGGYLSGLFFDLNYLITFLCNNNKIVKNILDTLSTVASFVMLYFINLSTNYGQFRVYVIAMFVFSLLLERITLGKIIAKTKNACYNAFVKITKKITKVKKDDAKEKI